MIKIEEHTVPELKELYLAKLDLLEDMIPNIDLEGLKTLLVEKTDFFQSPSSTVYDLCIPHGLLIHSIRTYNALKRACEAFPGIQERSIIVAGLLHDICKVNTYAHYFRNQEVEGVWKKVDAYRVEDNFPIGHGEKSIYMLSKYFKMTREEAAAIRWHRGLYDADGTQLQAIYFSASRLYPLVNLLHFANSIAKSDLTV